MTYIRAQLEDGKIYFQCTSCPWHASTDDGKLWAQCPECNSNVLMDHNDMEPMDMAKDAKLEKFINQDIEDDNLWKFGDYGGPFGDYGY